MGENACKFAKTKTVDTSDLENLFYHTSIVKTLGDTCKVVWCVHYSPAFFFAWSCFLHYEERSLGTSVCVCVCVCVCAFRLMYLLYVLQFTFPEVKQMKAALKKFLEEEPSVETIYYAVTTMANVGIKSEYTCTCTTVSVCLSLSLSLSLCRVFAPQVALYPLAV